MRFYQQQHEFYCRVDLHARSMHVCLVDADGQTKVHKNIDPTPDCFLPLIRPYREGLVVAAECMLAWYWLADRRTRKRPVTDYGTFALYCGSEPLGTVFASGSQAISSHSRDKPTQTKYLTIS